MVLVSGALEEGLTARIPRFATEIVILAGDQTKPNRTDFDGRCQYP
jgi:hypothetical protein